MLEKVQLSQLVTALTCLFSSVTDLEQSPVYFNSKELHYVKNVTNDCQLQVIDGISEMMQKVQNLRMQQATYMLGLQHEITELKKFISNQYCINDGTTSVDLNSEHIEPFDVICQSNKYGANWMLVAQSRSGTKLSKSTSDEQIINGFGEVRLDGDFFIGLKRVHAMTESKLHELLILFEDSSDVEHYHRYNSIAFAKNDNKYVLKLLQYHDGDGGADNQINRIFSLDKIQLNAAGKIQFFLRAKNLK